VLSPEQAKKLLEVAKGSRLEALLTLALLTGMQRGELLALRWADINLEEAHLLVNHTVNRIGKRLQSEASLRTTRKRKRVGGKFCFLH
jgi:integrase